MRLMKSGPRLSVVFLAALLMARVPVPAEGLGARTLLSAAGRGLPWVGLTDGKALPLEARALRRRLEAEGARPVSAAAADFNGDGAADIAVGYADRGGIVAVFPARIESVESAPFLDP